MLPSTTVPQFGEIRLGYVPGDTNRVHRYVGFHPYLVISNNKYNAFSGQCEVIPFTTKRFGKYNPVHVDFAAGEVEGLLKNSTLVVESRDILRNDQLGQLLGTFTPDNWKKVVPAILTQNPILNAMQHMAAPPKSTPFPCTPARCQCSGVVS